MKPWMTEAIGTQNGGRAVIGLPGGFRDVGEIRHAFQIASGEVALVEERQRGVERTAGDQVTGRAGFELGIQHRVVFGRTCPDY
jgi:uncharacterized cupin superfamily protein